MKKSLLTISGTLLAMTTTFAAFGVGPAYADDHGGHDGWSMNFSSQGNTSANTSGANSAGNTTGTFNSNMMQWPVLPSIAGNHADGDHENNGQSDDHNQGKKMKQLKSHDKTDKMENQLHLKANNMTSTSTSTSTGTATNTAATAQLHAALAVFHQDILNAQAAHRSLQQAVRDFVTAMQDAVAAGDVSAIQQSTTQAQSIITTLKQALAAQEQADAQSEDSTSAANQGNLAAALQAIQAAQAREVSKTNAMTQAAKGLETLTAQIEQAVASYSANSSSTANNTTGNATSNTSGSASANNVVTINNTVQ